MPPSQNPILDEIEQLLDKTSKKSLFPLFDKRDGAARLAQTLPTEYSGNKIIEGSDECRVWELSGLYYLNQGRPHEALPIFSVLYYQMLNGQKFGKRVHKGLPLVWMYECYLMMGFVTLAKRYLMLTLVEDAIRENGKLSSETGGVYFRLVWRHGLPDSEVQRYAKEAHDQFGRHPNESLFPEWILHELDKNWMTEFPIPQEAAVYSANPIYVKHLIDQLGDTSGATLERLAEYILSCMPGCRTARRRRSHSSDYDIVCSVEGLEVDFRSELGRYFVCECKDWQSPAGYTTMAKFCRVLDSTKSRFGILFSKKGISGEGRTVDAEREQLKVFQDRGMVIVVIDQSDLEHIARGGSFINLLRAKYERVRLDLISL
jgi:hypothetical protein